MESNEEPKDPLNCDPITRNQINVDPRDLQIFEGEMNPKTLKIYKNTWMEFITMRNIEIGKVPDENDFLIFLEMKRSHNIKGNTIKAMYSHLNKIYTRLYRTTLSNLSTRIYKTVEDYCKDEPVHSSKTFKSEEILRYCVYSFNWVCCKT